MKQTNYIRARARYLRDINHLPDGIFMAPARLNEIPMTGNLIHQHLGASSMSIITSPDWITRQSGYKAYSLV